MKLLLDTHVFLWVIGDSGKLSERVRDEVTDSENKVYVSAISLWEIAIKVRIGKLNLGKLRIEDLISISEKIGIEMFGLSPEEAVSYSTLSEETHFDPFDRMLIWQAIQRNLILVSKDSAFDRFAVFGLKLLWK